MATAFKHEGLGSLKQVVGYALSRIVELTYNIELKENELKMWQEIIVKYDPCQRCGGKGEYRVMTAQDESHMEKCDVCGGTGRG